MSSDLQKDNSQLHLYYVLALARSEPNDRLDSLILVFDKELPTDRLFSFFFSPSIYTYFFITVCGNDNNDIQNGLASLCVVVFATDGGPAIPATVSVAINEMGQEQSNPWREVLGGRNNNNKSPKTTLSCPSMGSNLEAFRDRRRRVRAH